MMNKVELLKLVKHVHKKGQGIPDRQAMHPRREWLTGLFIFLILVVAGAAYSIHLFESYKRIDQRTYTVDVTLPTYNQAGASTVLAYYAGRSQSYHALKEAVGFEATRVETVTASSTLTDTAWQWQRSDLDTLTPIVPEDPTLFVLTFAKDGTFFATTDCNTLSGTYVEKTKTLAIGPIAATKKFCSGQTLEGTFRDALSQATTYALGDQTLTITLSSGTSTMTFVRIGEVVTQP